MTDRAAPDTADQPKPLDTVGSPAAAEQSVRARVARNADVRTEDLVAADGSVGGAGKDIRPEADAPPASSDQTQAEHPQAEPNTAEPVENRPNVGTTTPEAYPKDDAAGSGKPDYGSPKRQD